MSQWAFVIAAYAVVTAGSAALSWLSFRAMRRAEAAAESLRGRE
jgi:hypothetical protein